MKTHELGYHLMDETDFLQDRSRFCRWQPRLELEAAKTCLNYILDKTAYQILNQDPAQPNQVFVLNGNEHKGATNFHYQGAWMENRKKELCCSESS